MTERGATDLDMNTKTLFVSEEATKWVMVGSSTTTVKFYDNDKIMINADAEVRITRKNRSPLVVRSWNNTVETTDAPEVNLPLFAFAASALALLLLKVLRR